MVLLTQFQVTAKVCSGLDLQKSEGGLSGIRRAADLVPLL
jgi:hypothetical protein